MALIAVMQHPGPVTSVLLAATAWMAVKHRPTIGWAIAALPAAYAFTDLYLAVLHMFLDHERSATHVLSPIRVLADSFQQHHAETTGTITGNHMRDIDVLISSVAAVLFFWHFISRAMRKELPRVLYFWALLVCLLGELAIFNHSKMHARTHSVPIPSWIESLQDQGLLLSPKFHRIHHTVFTENYSFLVGGAAYYDHIYRQFPQYDVLQVLFWCVQPHTVVSAISIGTLVAFPTSKAHIKAD